MIELVREEELEPLWERTDLALSAREVAVTDSTVEGVVHNIGSAAATVVVALVDHEGRVRARQALGQLQAPLDLYPRRRDFHPEVAGDSLQGWTLVVDPDADVPEITEDNNAVQLGGIAPDRTPYDPLMRWWVRVEHAGAGWACCWCIRARPARSGMAHLRTHVCLASTSPSPSPTR